MDLAAISLPATVVLRAGAPLLSSLHAMRCAGVDTAPVLDEFDRLVGELRMGRAMDLLRQAPIEDGPVRVGCAMSFDMQKVCASASLHAAMERMRTRDIASIYVVSRNLRLVGVLQRDRLERAIGALGGCAADPGQHANCRGRWCRHASFCTDADEHGDAARGA